MPRSMAHRSLGGEVPAASRSFVPGSAPPFLSLVAMVCLGLLILPAAPAGAQSCDPCPARTTADLNLRKGPSFDDAVVLVIPAAAEVLRAVSGDTNGFAQVTYDGVTGWAAVAYLVGSGFGPGLDELTVAVDLNLRAGPSFDDAVLRVMPAGSRVIRGDQLVNGFRLVNFDGTTGWAFAEFLVEPGGVPSPETRVTLVDLNLRAGPSLADAVILVMPAGRTVTLTRQGDANGYVTVDFGGTLGWAAAEFLG